MKKLLSYLWPQTSKISSEHSGTLEVTWYNGKKLLDTQNANYSYGLLQKVLEFGLSKVSLAHANSVLVLGLGGGSVVHSLRNKLNYDKQIDAVEWDEKIITIAKNEFEIFNSDKLKIYHEDALEFVKNCISTYDLIVVDLFIDTEVPEQFLTRDFCEKLLQLSTSSILFNLGIHLSEDHPAHHVTSFFKHHPEAHLTVLDHVQGKNTLLLIKKGHS